MLKRRYFASLEAERQGKDSVTLPCITLGEGDDAEALEISMIENMLRQNPDQVTQWESHPDMNATPETFAARHARNLDVKRRKLELPSPDPAPHDHGRRR